MGGGLDLPELEAAYLENRGLFQAILLNRAFTPDAAEDLVQDLYLKLPRLAGRLPTADDARHYMIRAVINMARDVHKTRARRARLLGVHGRPVVDHLDSTPEAALADRRLRDAIAALPERQRAVLLDVRLFGRAHLEVARTHDVSVSLIEKELRAALLHVRERV